MATSISVIDHSFVTPRLFTSAAEIHAPLTFLDMNWLHFNPIQQLLFYEIPGLSDPQFAGDFVPKLKHSLSFTLQYFPLLAGNLIIHPNSDSAMPEIRYTSGNGVAFIVAECNKAGDFHRLASNDETDCDEFHPLIAELKSSLLQQNEDSDSVVSATPVLALQVTLFPNRGLSIGISTHHTVGDARSIFHFVKTWAILHSKLSQDYNKDADAHELLVSESLPVFDKNLIQDKKGLDKILLDKWNSFIKRQKSLIPRSTPTKVTKFRKTFVISPKEIEKLKKSVPNLAHVSSFTVICSYAWTCLVKSRQVINQEDEDDDGDLNDHFLFTADCRERSDPPIPANYFGNCLVACLTNAKTAELAGERGLQIAAESIGRAIQERFQSKEAMFDGVEERFETIRNVKSLRPHKIISVAGSTRFNFYCVDFGWGNPLKFGVISINQTGAISVTGSRYSDGSVEVALCLTNKEMNAFSRLFREGLTKNGKLRSLL